MSAGEYYSHIRFREICNDTYVFVRLSRKVQLPKLAISRLSLNFLFRRSALY